MEFLRWKWPLEQNELIGAQAILILNGVIEGELLVIREANLRGIAVLAQDIVGVRGVTKSANRFRNETELRQALRKLPEIIPVNLPSRNRRERPVQLAFDSITKTPNVGRISGFTA